MRIPWDFLIPLDIRKFFLAKKGVSFSIDIKPLQEGVSKYLNRAGISKKDSRGADKKTKFALGLQAMNWMINGSSRSNRTPPIKFGVLKGSFSVFVGSLFVGDSSNKFFGGTPLKSGLRTGEKNLASIFIIANTDYAAKMESELTPAGDLQLGPVSRRSPGSGGHYIEGHLKADRNLYVSFYARMFKKETGG